MDKWKIALISVSVMTAVFLALFVVAFTHKPAHCKPPPASFPDNCANKKEIIVQLDGDSVILPEDTLNWELQPSWDNTGNIALEQEADNKLKLIRYYSDPWVVSQLRAEMIQPAVLVVRVALLDGGRSYGLLFNDGSQYTWATGNVGQEVDTANTVRVATNSSDDTKVSDCVSTDDGRPMFFTATEKRIQLWRSSDSYGTTWEIVDKNMPVFPDGGTEQIQSFYVASSTERRIVCYTLYKNQELTADVVVFHSNDNFVQDFQSVNVAPNLQVDSIKSLTAQVFVLNNQEVRVPVFTGTDSVNIYWAPSVSGPYGILQVFKPTSQPTFVNAGMFSDEEDSLFVLGVTATGHSFLWSHQTDETVEDPFVLTATPISNIQTVFLGEQNGSSRKLFFASDKQHFQLQYDGSSSTPTWNTTEILASSEVVALASQKFPGSGGGMVCICPDKGMPMVQSFGSVAEHKITVVTGGTHNKK